MGEQQGLSRRQVLSGLAAAGVATPLVAACGGGGNGGSGTTAGGQASGVVNISDVPVGGGAIRGEVVVAQPTKGQFKAFSAVCTHQHCLVSRIEGDAIICTCHGSEYSLEDGSVLQGPATQPLEQLTATVKGDQVDVS